jgi:serine/threonine protein kinase
MSNSAESINLWAKQLEKKINQRNFHKLFKAKRKIGKGAFATVYLAESLVDQRMVAVKAFSKEKQYSGDKGRESLENEVKIMRLLDDHNVMKLEGVYET